MITNCELRFTDKLKTSVLFKAHSICATFCFTPVRTIFLIPSEAGAQQGGNDRLTETVWLYLQARK